MTERVKLEGKCPFGGDRIGGALGSGMTLEEWWPNRLRVELLHQDPAEADPLDPDFDYAEAFSKLDLDEVKQDIKALLKSSQPWWPSDFGNYGPQMIRMAWHAAGTYRIADGRGGAGQAMQRFAPINSWEDNGNIDKSRRLLWPVKKKYGKSLSWGDLMILTGNCALEIMGFDTFGFGGGRIDAWEPDRATYWGPEKEMLARDRWEGAPDEAHYDLENPMGNSQFGLIYVNPEGPASNNVPEDSAREIRMTFGRMAMNDEETVALIAGGHAFGKSHGAVSPDDVGPPPEAAPMEAQGLGWMNKAGTGFAEYTMTNGIEGSWTPQPTRWDNDYLSNLFKYEWKQTTAPSGATQWTPTDESAPKAPDAHKPGVEHPLMMMTSDIALKVDPSYRKICEKFLEDFDYFADAFARAWYKLTHRDMGPKTRYLGPEVPEQDLIWQDPTPARDYDLIDQDDIARLKAEILDSGLTVSELVGVAWGAASSHRVSDKRGGADGGRIRLAPMKDWAVNNPAEIKKVVETLERIKDGFDGAQSGNKKVSIADLIVLGGCAAVEKAAQDAGVEARVPFTPGRTDATDAQTDEQSFDWLRPVADGFRNFLDSQVRYQVAPEQIFLDRAALLGLNAPEWTVLTGGLRVLDINTGGAKEGVFTDRPGVLSNDFFTNLTTMDYYWHKADEDGMSFEIRSRADDSVAFTATRCDLVFGANSQLRQISEVYASDDGHEKMVHDFIKAWNKVMMLDRFDVKDARSAA